MEARACLLVCVFVSVLVCGVSGQVAMLCRPNERFLSCGGCQKTCRDPVPTCQALCRVGCYCNEDEVRDDTGRCVKLADCPPVLSAYREDTSEPRSQLACQKDEEYKFCETCNRTCDNPNPICPAQCNRGCFCKGNLVRDRNGKCVKYENCSRFPHENESSNYIQPIPYMITCGPRQVYKDCENCEKTCSNPNPVCPAQCNRGCFCMEGFVKAPNGQCVKLQNCPKAEVTMGEAHEPSVEDCASDEEYLLCGWCEPTCSEPSPDCPYKICTMGCLCKPPLLRNYNGHCVEEKDCVANSCRDPNEEYGCRYGCEATCEKRQCKDRPRRCSLGCHCRFGLLRDSRGRCVTSDMCENYINSKV